MKLLNEFLQDFCLILHIIGHLAWDTFSNVLHEFQIQSLIIILSQGSIDLNWHSVIDQDLIQLFLFFEVESRDFLCSILVDEIDELEILAVFSHELDQELDPIWQLLGLPFEACFFEDKWLVREYGFEIPEAMLVRSNQKIDIMLPSPNLARLLRLKRSSWNEIKQIQIVVELF